MAALNPKPPGAAGAIVLLSSLLAGCVMFAPERDMQPIKSVDAYESASSLTGSRSPWPSDQWWLACADRQLDQLIEEGLRDATEMRIAAARVAAGQAAVEPARGALLPTLDSAAMIDTERQSYNYLIGKQFVPRGWNDGGAASLSLNWEIDFWGKNRAALAAATSEAEAAEAEAAATRLALSTGIADAYAMLATLYAGRDSYAQAVKVRKATVELMTGRYNNQLENTGGADRARSAEAAAEAQLAEADEQIALVKNQIAALLGAGPDRALKIGRPRVIPARFGGVPENLPVNLLGRRPDIVAARLHVDAAAKKIDVARAAFYPNVNLAAVIGRQALGIDLLTAGDSTFGSVGPAVSLPIFDGGRLRAGEETAGAQYDIAVATYDKTLTEALHQVSDALVSKRALVLRLGGMRRSLTMAESAWRVVSDRYAGGLATYLEVLAAEDALIQTRHAVAMLQTRAFVLDVALIRALGGGYRQSEKTQ